MTTPTAYSIPVTSDELDTIAEALRYMAADMETTATINRRNEASALRGLAYEFEARHRAAVIEAGRVEMGREEED